MNSHAKKKYELKYEPQTLQGQCTLQSVTPVFFSRTRFGITIALSIILGLWPLLIIYWFPNLQKLFYYPQCQIDQCSHFYIVNYDKAINITTKKCETQDKILYFINRFLKYTILDGQVKVVSYSYDKRLEDLVSSTKIKPLSKEEVIFLRKKFGIGSMDINRPSIPTLLLTEVLKPLYVFVLLGLIFWIPGHYYYYASMLFVVGVVGIVVSLYQANEMNKKICELASYQTSVHVFRAEGVTELSSRDVVPGDIVFFQESIKVPFDCIILEGSCLVNQCALTGESVPVVKKASDSSTTSQLLEGTTLVQVDLKHKMSKFEQYREQFGMPTLIIRTNFTTTKGQLIRIISFPSQRGNVFQNQANYFLLFLLALSFCTSSVMLIKTWNQIDTVALIIKFIDLITITVPPSLPISMTFGIIYAIQKMEKKGIFCVSPNKVIAGGLIDLICFDKTGTLTEDHMDFFCLVPAHEGNFKTAIENQQDSHRLNEILSRQKYVEKALANMAVNHSIVRVEATKENVGDPMEIKLFEFGQFNFSHKHEQPDALFSFTSSRGHDGEAFRRFDFDSELLRMSVIGRCTFTNDDFYIFSKGSPEAMIEIFNSKTIPHDFYDMLNKYAAMGLRVLAIGSRKIHKTSINCSRKQLENDLEFNGFEVFENRLKPQTKAAISQLNRAELPCVMITGDNALTACNISLECGIANPCKKMFIYQVKNSKLKKEEFRYTPTVEEKNNFIQFEQAGEQIINEDPSNRKEHTQLSALQLEIQSLLSELQQSNAGQICLTGAAFNYLFPAQMAEKITNLHKKLLSKTKVFARTKPNDKTRIITSYQNCGKTVSMCGDGANDCGALKQADIGLSLSPAEASISAPFTSKITNITSMIQLIKECRAGLVTNFSLFNIMVMYSLIQYTTSAICDFQLTYPPDLHYLYWDLGLNFFFFITYGYTQTANKLSKQKPKRTLFTLQNIISILAFYFIQLIGQILMAISTKTIFKEYFQLVYDPNQPPKHIQFEINLDTPISNVLFLFSNLLYLSSVLFSAITEPWRKPLYTNIPFVIIFIVMTVYSLFIVVFPRLRISMFYISYLDDPTVNQFILICTIFFAVLSYFNHKFLIPKCFAL